MVYYQCRCGDRWSHGSMAPPRCMGCEKCGTSLASHPSGLGTPSPHEFMEEQVQTDQGPQPLSRCRFCGKTRQQTEAAGG